MHYYQHHIGDYRRDTSHLSLLEHGVYRQLLDMYYLSESKIPAETEVVYRRLCARTDEEKKAVDNVLSEFFKWENGWIQTRCDEEIAGYQGKADRARVNGKLGGRPPKTKAVISGNPEQTDVKANHKPLTINQEPITNTKTPTAPSEKTVRSTPKEKIDFQDGKFTNTDRRIELWREAYPAVNIQSEMAKAAAWLLANPKNAKQNHERFLTNWLARAQEKAPAQGGASDPVYQTLVEKYGSAKRRPDGRIYAGGRIFNADGSGGLCL